MGFLRCARALMLLSCAFASVACFADVTVPAGATFDLNGGTLQASGDVHTSGTFRLGAGQVLGVGAFRILAGNTNLGSGLVRLIGDWENRGTLVAGTSRVEFRDGAAVSDILGSSTFATLSLVSATGKRYRLESGSTQRVATLLEVIGQGAPIQIDVTVDGSIANVDLLVGGTQSITNVGVSDVHAVGQPLAPTLSNQGGSGNATGWFGQGGGIPAVVPPQFIPALDGFGLLLLGLLFGVAAWRRRDTFAPASIRA